MLLAMTRIKDADSSPSSYLIRPVRPGDMGTIISRHGSIVSTSNHPMRLADEAASHEPGSE